MAATQYISAPVENWNIAYTLAEASRKSRIQEGKFADGVIVREAEEVGPDGETLYEGTFWLADDPMELPGYQAMVERTRKENMRSIFLVGGLVTGGLVVVGGIIAGIVYAAKKGKRARAYAGEFGAIPQLDTAPTSELEALLHDFSRTMFDVSKKYGRDSTLYGVLEEAAQSVREELYKRGERPRLVSGSIGRIHEDVKEWTVPMLRSKRRRLLEKLERLETEPRGPSRMESYKMEHGELDRDLAVVDKELRRRGLTPWGGR